MTELKYLNDTYLYESKAKFLEFRENEKGKAIILDETIFYPQGGGQPSDKGEMIFGDNIYKINDVRLDENGDVWHFGDFENTNINNGDNVLLKIDKDLRILNSTLHSAGHLLDCGVSELKIDNLKATKGYHFSNGPYVEYDGTIENPLEIIPKLQEIIDKLIKNDLLINKKDFSYEEATEKGIFAPIGKKARVVNFEGYPTCGCGGTHVLSSGEIGKLIIKKIKSSNGKTKISYDVEY